jgi:hypothetical protein
MPAASDGLFKGNPPSNPPYFSLVRRILESLRAEPERWPTDRPH